MLKIGSLEFAHPVLQAALSGYSDLPMRRIARACGAAGTLNEVVLDRVAIQRGKKRRQIMNVEPDDHPVGGQLMGAEPDTIAIAADQMIEAGYDWIDINFGCPVRKVLRRKRGGYLLTDPPAALAIIRAVFDVVDGRVPVAVKLRRGYDDTARSAENVMAIVDGVFEIGVDAITLHPRTVEQAYEGKADWSFLASVKSHVGAKTILGSGDLFSAADVVAMTAETAVDGVTLARGCIGNPWLFAQSAAALAGEPLPDPPSIREQGEMLVTHFNLCADYYGTRTACTTMRKFGIAYSRLHPDHELMRSVIAGAQTPGDWREILARWYGPEIAAMLALPLSERPSESF